MKYSHQTKPFSLSATSKPKSRWLVPIYGNLRRIPEQSVVHERGSDVPNTLPSLPPALPSLYGIYSCAVKVSPVILKSFLLSLLHSYPFCDSSLCWLLINLLKIILHWLGLNCFCKGTVSFFCGCYIEIVFV